MALLFSPTFMELMNLYDIESTLSHSARIRMYAKIIEKLDEDGAYDVNHLFHVVFKDVVKSLTNYHDELHQNEDVFKDFHAFPKIFNMSPPILKKQKHLYNDSQNVHEFGSSAIDVAKKIINEYPAKYERLFDHVFFDVIENITTENSGISGTDLFASIYTYIMKHEHKNDLLKRLFEEMHESIGTCSMGHITRLINSLRGFGNNFFTTLDEYEAEKAKLFDKFNKELDLRGLFSIRDFEILINSGKIEFSADHHLVLRILKDYSKVNWCYKFSGDKIIFSVN